MNLQYCINTFMMVPTTSHQQELSNSTMKKTMNPPYFSGVNCSNMFFNCQISNQIIKFERVSNVLRIDMSYS